MLHHLWKDHSNVRPSTITRRPQLWDPSADTWVQDGGSVVSVGAGCAKESWDQTSSCSEEKI